MYITHVANSSATFSFSGFTFQNFYGGSIGPSIEEDGGAIFQINGNLMFQNCKFINNSVYLLGQDVQRGGAIYLDTSGNFTVTGCYFSNNVAISGGAISVINASINIANSTFVGNSASLGLGGAIHLRAGVIIQQTAISYSLFQNNLASAGGAVLAELDSIVISSEFDNNTATGGDGNGAAWGCSFSGFNGTNCIFRYNQADSGGGGLFLSNGGGLCSNCQFIQNLASSGGGVCGQDQSSFTITNSLFQSNEALQWGGAVYSFSGTFYLINDTITDNTCVGEGGALYLGGETQGTMSGCTVTGNSSPQGNGVYCSDSKITITNVTFAKADNFFCAGFPVLTRCVTAGDGQWANYCPNFGANSGISTSTALVIGLVVGLVGLFLLVLVVGIGAFCMKKHKYLLWKEEVDE